MVINFNRLFEPLRIGNVEIKNRIAMAPMGIVGLLNPDGSLGQRGIDYYIERAKGGVGLIITGVFRVENKIEPSIPGSPLISHTAFAPFAELAEAVHALGSRIFAQLTAGYGRVANPQKLCGQPVSASPTANYWKPDITCRELKVEEVEQLVRCFGNAAEILAEAGIDGIELHGHEGYLFDQFATAIWNRRTDKYGGDLEGRMGLAIEVLHEIKGKVGQDFPVQYRFGLKHYMKGLNSGALPGETFREIGRDIEEGRQMTILLERVGFDALHVDAGCYESWYWPHPPIYQQHGCMIDMAAEAKKLVKIPVVGVGKIDIPQLAERVIAEGKADIVAIGKGLLADAFWVRKVEEGRPEYIRPCIGCHDGCMGRAAASKPKPLSCAVNPTVGRERTYRLEKTVSSKKVMVVGGGIAGLEAARVASLRGHKVTLYEKTNSLGGHLIEASIPEFKKDLKRLLKWYEEEIENLNLEIKLGTEVNFDILEHEKPDAVILATGSKPIIPNVPGIGMDKVITAIDLLWGKKKSQNKVCILGGGLIGCETALWLAQQGKKVTIIEMLGDLMISGIPVSRMNRMMLLDMLRFYNVNSITNTTLLGITADGVHLIDRCFEQKNLHADTVVLAVGLSPDQKLYRDLSGKIPNLFLIGDARNPQNIMGSIWDAYEVARII
jgi:2-enoate reductase